MVDAGWTIERAMEEQRRVCAADPNLPLRLQPVAVWQALQDLEAERGRHREGDPTALFAAIRLCAAHELPLPAWAAEAFIAGYDSVLGHRVGSWDEAFGRPHRKGLHLAKARQRRLLRARIRARIAALKKAEPQTATDRGLFERIGEEFGVSRNTVENLYYGMRRSPHEN